MLAGRRHLSFDPASGMVDNPRRVVLNSTPAAMPSPAGDCTRKTLAVLLDKFLSREDVDDIFLAAVDHCEPDPQYVAPCRQYAGLGTREVMRPGG